MDKETMFWTVVIVAIVCWTIVEVFKARSKDNRFADLAKLQALKDSGTLTDKQYFGQFCLKVAAGVLLF